MRPRTRRKAPGECASCDRARSERSGPTQPSRSQQNQPPADHLREEVVGTLHPLSEARGGRSSGRPSEHQDGVIVIAAGVRRTTISSDQPLRSSTDALDIQIHVPLTTSDNSVYGTLPPRTLEDLPALCIVAAGHCTIAARRS